MCPRSRIGFLCLCTRFKETQASRARVAPLCCPLLCSRRGLLRSFQSRRDHPMVPLRPRSVSLPSGRLAHHLHRFANAPLFVSRTHNQFGLPGIQNFVRPCCGPKRRRALRPKWPPFVRLCRRMIGLYLTLVIVCRARSEIACSARSHLTKFGPGAGDSQTNPLLSWTPKALSVLGRLQSRDHPLLPCAWTPSCWTFGITP